MNSSPNNFSLNFWLCILLVSILLGQLGCGNTSPNTAQSSPASAPPEAKPATELATSPEVIVALTPRSAEELRKYIKQADKSPTVFIAVAVENNCEGFRYELNLRESLEGENVLLTSCDGISLAIDRDDAAFLKGTFLDFIENPGGFKFENPHEDTMLLAEYRAQRDEEARMQPIEEAKAKLIKPEKAVADLLTPERQKAFEDLGLWWKFNQPEAWGSHAAMVGRVDRYREESGKWITVVFTGSKNKQKGYVYLIKDDGLQIRIFGGRNYLDDDDQFVDVNGDGVPEIVAATSSGAHDENDPNRFVSDATLFYILPISFQQAPLLEVIFDVRTFKDKATWRSRVAEGLAGTHDVIIEEQVMGGWNERARFIWSSEKSRYEGPGGSKEEGFIATAGEIDPTGRQEFMKLPTQ